MNKGKLFSGLFLTAVFLVVLVIIFMPVFGQKNGLQYLDDLYNSISKGSAYYIPKAQQEASAMAGRQIQATLKMKTAEQAEQSAKLFNEAGALVNVHDSTLEISGDLGRILSAAVADADKMYFNDAQALQAKYGYEGRQAAYNWWASLSALEKNLNKQKEFKGARAAIAVNSKAVEPAYNYYGIESQKISERSGVVIFSLVFYVVYTLWYGFGIMFLFEGLGFKLEH